MNVGRGYFRLAVAVVGSWIAVWGSVGAFAAWQQGIYTRIFIENRRLGHSLEELAYSDSRASQYGDLVAISLMWGLLAVPMALAFVLGWWVYRGFVPRG